MADYFTVDELRAAYPDLASANKFTVAKLELARSFAEQWFEAAAHVAFVPRDVTETLTGAGGRTLFLSRWAAVRAVTSASIDGVDLTADELAELVTRSHGVVERARRWPAGSTIVVTYRTATTSPWSSRRRP